MYSSGGWVLLCHWDTVSEGFTLLLSPIPFSSVLLCVFVTYHQNKQLIGEVHINA